MNEVNPDFTMDYDKTDPRPMGEATRTHDDTILQAGYHERPYILALGIGNVS